jgi:hypothetical protein
MQRKGITSTTMLGLEVIVSGGVLFPTLKAGKSDDVNGRK